MRDTILIISLLFLLLLGLSCEGQKVEAPKSKIHSPPVVTSADILPEKPNKASELSLIIQSQDPDRNPVTYHYQWMKNGEEILGGDRGALTSQNFRKGDLISVRVSPSSGNAEGVPFVSSPVRILNSPPEVQEVWIEPKVASVSSNLRALVKGTDLDRDFIYYTYRWEKNGTVLAEETGDVLEKDRFKKGDVIAVIVTPDDREGSGLSRKSDSVVISNSPPSIISFPPASAEGSLYTYQVKAIDPDEDLLAFELKSRPKGMEIDRETGLIRWEIRKEEKGSHTVEIEACDSDGAKSTQRYTLTLEFR